MAKPRIFVSSTFYDLRQVRADLERFIRDLGFEPVLHERGSVPYGHQDKLEAYCYKEISSCDILVSIIGNRFGSISSVDDYSVSQMELKTAIEQQKPVYIFVDQEVQAEFKTFKANKDRIDIIYASVDDSRVFCFLDEINALPNNNPIFPFGSVIDITSMLKEQWSGLFKNLLSEITRAQEITLSKELKGSLSTLRQMIDHIAKERSRRDDVIKTIVTQNHPLFAQIAEMTKTPYRVFFTNLDEMEKWLKAKSWNKGEDEEDMFEDHNWLCWQRDWYKNKTRKIKINNQLFHEDGRLKHFDLSEWKSGWVQFEDENKKETFDDLDDEIPF